MFAINDRQLCTIVKSYSEMERYNKIWKEAWPREQPFLGDCIRYIIHDEHGEDMASVEFIPYNPNFTSEKSLTDTSTIETYHSFHSYSLVKKEKKHIVEADKLAIKKEKQTIKNLIRVFSFLTLHAEINRIGFIASLLNPALYDIGKKRYKIPVVALHDNVDVDGFLGKPCLIYAKEIYSDKERYKAFNHFNSFQMESERKMVYSS